MRVRARREKWPVFKFALLLLIERQNLLMLFSLPEGYIRDGPKIVPGGFGND